MDQTKRELGVDLPDHERGRDVTVPDPDLGPSQCGVLAGPPPACGPAKCGNGQIDSCTTCTGGAPGGKPDAGSPPWKPDIGPVCTTLKEDCDGASLGATCASLGYAGGSLACGAACKLDVSGCNGCAGGGGIAACAQPQLGAQAPSRIEIATTGSRVAVAWISDNLRAPGGSAARRYLNLWVFDAQLKLVGKAECIGGEDPSSLAIAAVGADWMVASGGAQATRIYLLDGSSLLPVKTRQVAGASGPTLVGRPQGGPLLTFYEPSSALAGTLLDEKGGEQWRTKLVDRTFGEGTSGVFTGSGFLVADRRSTHYSDLGGVRVVRVDLDGKSATSTPGGTSTECPSLSWHGSFARLVWSDFAGAPKLFTAKLDEQGQRAGDAVELPYGKAYYNCVRTVPRGDDLLALLAGYTGLSNHGSHLAFTTLGPTGASLTPLTTLTKSPGYSIGHRLAPLGAQSVAAWIEASSTGWMGGDSMRRLGLALLAP